MAENRGPVNVGFVQLVDMADATAMYDGFTRTIEEAGLSDNIKIDYQDAAGDTGTMTTMIQSFVDNNYDLIVPMLTAVIFLLYSCRLLTLYIQR